MNPSKIFEYHWVHQSIRKVSNTFLLCLIPVLHPSISSIMPIMVAIKMLATVARRQSSFNNKKRWASRPDPDGGAA